MSLRNRKRSKDPWLEVLHWFTVAFMPLRSCNNPSLLFVFLWITKTGSSKDLLKVLCALVAGISVLEIGSVLIFPHERAVDQSIRGHQRPVVVF